jgi:predicted extracellular nuclease
MRFVHLFLLVFFIGFEVYSQDKYAILGFYNLENLFDTEDDPNTDDREFLPKGSNQWTVERYEQKLSNMARVIADMKPDILGVCEIENRRVLEDLIKTPALAARKYQIVHFESPDPRGVDVALLYRPSVFKPFEAFPYSLRFYEQDPKFKTRDHLVVRGLFAGKDTLTIIVNHWPSRRGGKEDARAAAGKTVRFLVDSLSKNFPRAKIAIMGDLNDDPSDVSVKKHLNADVGKKLKAQTLYNPLFELFKQGHGTLAYNGAWNLFDQIIITQSMLRKNEPATYLDKSARIFRAEYLFNNDGQYKGQPFRTFSMGKFINGYSDHLPVYILLSL